LTLLLDRVAVADGGVGFRHIGLATTNDDAGVIRFCAVVPPGGAALGGLIVDLLSSAPAFFAEKSGGGGAPRGVVKTRS
jgi:hypothetical protein